MSILPNQQLGSIIPATSSRPGIKKGQGSRHALRPETEQSVVGRVFTLFWPSLRRTSLALLKARISSMGFPVSMKARARSEFLRTMEHGWIVPGGGTVPQLESSGCHEQGSRTVPRWGCDRDILAISAS